MNYFDFIIGIGVGNYCSLRYNRNFSGCFGES